MMVVRCTQCEREVKWKDGEVFGTMEIECTGSTVICACGADVGEDGGVLRAFHVPQSAVVGTK